MRRLITDRREDQQAVIRLAGKVLDATRGVLSAVLGVEGSSIGWASHRCHVRGLSVVLSTGSTGLFCWSCDPSQVVSSTVSEAARYNQLANTGYYWGSKGFIPHATFLTQRRHHCTHATSHAAHARHLTEADDVEVYDKVEGFTENLKLSEVEE